MSNIKLDVFTQKRLSIYLILLNQFEAEGVTDIRFVRQRVQEHLNYRRKTERVQMSAHAKEQALRENVRNKRTTIEDMPNTLKKCPSCGKAYLLPAKTVTEPIIFCPACKYSEYIGV